MTDLSYQQEMETRTGVLVGDRSVSEIVPRPNEGKHTRLGMRVYPGGAGQWFLRIKDQGTCSCEHGPRLWCPSYRGTTCGTCGKRPGKHRRRVLSPSGTLRFRDGRWYRGTEETPIQPREVAP